MNRITVTFLHPTNRSPMEVEVDVSLTADAIVHEFIAANFIRDILSHSGYRLYGPGIKEFDGIATLAEAGVTDGDVLCPISWYDDG